MGRHLVCQSVVGDFDHWSLIGRSRNVFTLVIYALSEVRASSGTQHRGLSQQRPTHIQTGTLPLPLAESL